MCHVTTFHQSDIAIYMHVDICMTYASRSHQTLLSTSQSKASSAHTVFKLLTKFLALPLSFLNLFYMVFLGPAFSFSTIKIFKLLAQVFLKLLSNF